MTQRAECPRCSFNNQQLKIGNIFGLILIQSYLFGFTRLLRTTFSILFGAQKHWSPFTFIVFSNAQHFFFYRHQNQNLTKVLPLTLVNDSGPPKNIWAEIVLFLFFL